MDIETPKTIDEWNAAGMEFLPGYMGMEFESVGPDEVVATMQIARHHNIWNGFLHSGSVVAFADTCCGYGTVASLPDGAAGFTTIELKTNFLSTLRKGVLRCFAKPVHQGRTTQVWDAEVMPDNGSKSLAHFRCTQMILWPRA